MVCITQMEVIVNKKRKFKPDGAKIFSVVASLAIIAALAVGVVSIVKSASGEKKQNYIDLNVADNQSDSQPDSKVNLAMAETTIYEQQEKTEPEETLPAAVEETESPVQVNAKVYSFNEGSSLIWPVEGKVILGYNMDSTIYFPTLEQYKCNPAVIIGAEAGSQVISAAPGVVESIYEDPVIGKSMVVSIGDGYKITYGQLEDVQVEVADDVLAGTVLGKVANPTKFYTVEGSNLYFQLNKDGNSIDPMLYLVENN